MKQHTYLLLLILSTQLFGVGEFTRSLIPPALVLSQEPPEVTKEYIKTELHVVEDSNIKLAAAPFLIWTEAGMSAYQAITKPMLESQALALKKIQAAGLLIKICNGQKISSSDLNFLATSFQYNSSDIPYAPFVYGFTDNGANSKVSGRVVQKIPIVKIDIANEEGANLFMAFPTSNQPLTINDIAMPPIVFAEYGGLLVVYSLDLPTGKIAFFDPQKTTSSQKPTCSTNPKQPCTFLKNKLPMLAQKYSKEFLLHYAEFLKGNFNAK